MAALYGSVQGNRGEAHRLGSKDSGMDVRAQTWQTFARIGMSADGSGIFTLKDDHGHAIATVRWGPEGKPIPDRVDAVEAIGLIETVERGW